MSVELVTQQDVRPAQKLPFCYLCGKQFTERELPNTTLSGSFSLIRGITMDGACTDPRKSVRCRA